MWKIFTRSNINWNNWPFKWSNSQQDEYNGNETNNFTLSRTYIKIQKCNSYSGSEVRFTSAYSKQIKMKCIRITEITMIARTCVMAFIRRLACDLWHGRKAEHKTDFSSLFYCKTNQRIFQLLLTTCWLTTNVKKQKYVCKWF